MIIDSKYNDKKYRLTKSERTKLIFYMSVLITVALAGFSFSIILFILTGPVLSAFIACPLISTMSILLIIFSRKYYLDLGKDEVDVYTGKVTQTDESGIESPIYHIYINNIAHHVGPFIYLKVKTGDEIEIRKAPFSKNILSVKIL